jgi:hypothetical protein
VVSFWLVGMLAANVVVDVESPTECMSAAAISGRLASLLPPDREAGDPRRGPDVARIARSGEGPTDLWLTLTRADGTSLGARKLPGQRGCMQLVDLVAVMIGSWEFSAGDSAWGEGLGLGLGRTPTASVLDPAPASAPAAEALARAPEPTSGPAHDHLALEMGAGAGAMLLGGVTRSAGVELLGGPARGPLWVRFALADQAARTRALAPGQIAWQRYLATAGVSWRFGVRDDADRRWAIALDGAAAAALATLTGAGFLENRSRSYIELGLDAGVRVGRRLGSTLTLYAEVRGRAWSQRQRAIVDGVPGSSELPRVDLIGGIGATFAINR